MGIGLLWRPWSIGASIESFENLDLGLVEGDLGGLAAPAIAGLYQLQNAGGGSGGGFGTEGARGGEDRDGAAAGVGLSQVTHSPATQTPPSTDGGVFVFTTVRA